MSNGKYYLQVENDMMVCFDETIHKFSVFVKVDDTEVAKEIQYEDKDEVHKKTSGSLVKCSVCRKVGHSSNIHELKNNTVLTEKESKIKSLKEMGKNSLQVSNELNIPLDEVNMAFIKCAVL